MQRPLPSKRVIGIDITLGRFAAHVQMFATLGREHRSSYVCCVNPHMAGEAWNDKGFAAVVNHADLSTADGMPILCSLQLFHCVKQERMAGNDIMPALVADAERQGLSIYLYAGKQEVLDAITARAAKDHPRLRVAGA